MYYYDSKGSEKRDNSHWEKFLKYFRHDVPSSVKVCWNCVHFNYDLNDYYYNKVNFHQRTAKKEWIYHITRFKLSCKMTNCNLDKFLEFRSLIYISKRLNNVTFLLLKTWLIFCCDKTWSILFWFWFFWIEKQPLFSFH